MKNSYLKQFLVSTLALTGIFASSNAATAAILTTPTQTRTVPEQGGDFTATDSVDQFDPMLGDLISVHVFLSATANSVGAPNALADGDQAIACFDGGGACAGTLTGRSSVDLNVQGGANLASVLPLTSQTFDLLEGENVPIPSQTATETTDGFLTITDSGTLADFTGLGQVDLDFVADGESVLSASSGTPIGNLVVTSEGEFQVFYTYETQDPSNTTVPEPSAMLALGLISGLGTLARKKKQ